MPAASPLFLVAAITGRALAASAARGGHRVAVADCFADRDTRLAAGACRLVVARRGLRFDRRALLAAAADLAPVGSATAVVYGSGFEGRTRLLAELTAGRRLLGNAPAVVAAVRDVRRFFALLDRLGIDHPATRHTAPRARAGWLVKQPGGAGGAHVRRAGRAPAPAGAYYQRFEAGTAMSALFLANGCRAQLVGFNEQWAVPARPGRPFLYGGAVGGVVPPGAVAADLAAKVDALVASTGLVGLNGLDFLLQGERWLVLEVNPRPTATMDLYDLDYSRGLFDWHVRACEGELPERVARPRAVRAHAVVYVTGPLCVPADFPFPRWCSDVPDGGARLGPGDPLCTVHAAARDVRRATALVRRRHAWLARATTALAA